MNLELIALDRAWAREIEAEGNASLQAACSNYDEIAPYLEDAVDAHVALYERTRAMAPWIAYLARLVESREIVGICSFKDKCAGGRVEIAYYTFAPYRRRGFGRIMAARLVELALRYPDVVEVVAHTLPEESPSTRILRKLGFHKAGSIDDPEDGEVWLWTLSRSSAAEHGAASHFFVPMSKVGALLSLMARRDHAAL